MHGLVKRSGASPFGSLKNFQGIKKKKIPKKDLSHESKPVELHFRLHYKVSVRTDSGGLFFQIVHQKFGTQSQPNPG